MEMKSPPLLTLTELSALPVHTVDVVYAGQPRRVLLREINLGERNALLAMWRQHKDDEVAAAQVLYPELVALTLANEAGGRLVADSAAVAAMPAALVQSLAEAALRLNGLVPGEDDDDTGEE